jgi:TonB-dependent receptor
MKNKSPSFRFFLTITKPVFKLAALIFLAAICASAPVPAQSAQPAAAGGGIEGSVYNAPSGLPLGRAKVSIKGVAGLESLTDDEGRFRFTNIPAGAVRLEISYLGFDSQTTTVTVAPGETTTRDFQLAREGTSRSGGKGDDVVVMEKYSVIADQTMSAQALAMNEQRHAASIKHIVAMEELGSFGTENIGDYIRFLPGVAIIDDGEDAGQLGLGGFGPEFTNVQLDGGDVASTGAGTPAGAGTVSKRNLTLAEVPMVNIERVEVTKVPTPDMPASGLGGSMNLVSKGLLGTKRAYLDYQLYMNFDNKDGLSFDGGVKQLTPQTSPKNKKPSFNTSIVVPMDRRLVFSAGISRSWRARPASDTPTETAIWNLRTTEQSDPTISKDIALASAEWSQIAQITVTENAQFGVEWRVARNDTLSLALQKRQLTTDRSTSRLSTRFYLGSNFDPVGGADWTAAPNPATAGGEFEMGQNGALNFREKTDNVHATLRYRHRGSNWHIDGQAVYSHAKRTKTNHGQGYFAGIYALGTESMSPRKGYQMEGYGINSTKSILPTTYVAKNAATGEAASQFDGGDYLLHQVRDEDGCYKTDMYSGKVDVTRFFGRHLSIKTGASFNRMTKDDWQLPSIINFSGDPTIGPQTTAGIYERKKLKYYIEDYPYLLTPGVQMNGHDVIWISPVGVYKLSQLHPEWFTTDKSAIQYRAERSKKMTEDIAAAYMRIDLKLFSNRLHAIGGVRYEKTDLDGWSVKTDPTAIYVRDPETGLPMRTPDQSAWQQLDVSDEEKIRLQYQERAFHEGQSYGDFYPSLNINYAFTENLVLRAAYARTLGRPNIQYVVNGITIPNLTEREDDDPVVTVTVGNPALKPWTADSFHLSLDSYFLKGGFGSVGVYRKFVSNFFQSRNYTATRADFEHYGINSNDIDFMLANNYAIRRTENIGDARLTGLEFSYRQDLFFLPRWLQKIQVWVNYTRMQLDGTNSKDFTGFTPEALSWGVNYIRPRFSLRLTCAYQAETKSAAVGTGGNAGKYIPSGTYEYQNAYTRYGLTAEYALSRAFALYVNWNDLIGDDRIKYRRADGTPAYAQNYQRTVTPAYIMVGVKGRF